MIPIAYSEIYNHPLPPGHRFPMLKYELIPGQLLYEGTIVAQQLFTPEPIDLATARLVHTPEYLNKLIRLGLSASEIRKSGFPLSQQLIDRELIITGGTCACSDFALEYGVSFNVAGGTHHASSHQAEGFCLLNDQAVAASRLLYSQKSKAILIIDLDVHQGNGTAEIFSGNPQVFSFSMHAGHNFPLKKEKSSLDIPLPDGCSDDTYLETLKKALQHISESFNPDFVFYQSGVDVLATDKIGRLSLSKSACMERDRMVLNYCFSQGLPLVITMGGGYSEKISDIVDAHCNTFRVATEIYS